jgi:tetrapyrrole methylase family protein/MazG family protein
MKYTFDGLVNIMEKLRRPGGCPWDAEQTHESIKKCMIEETYEVIDALDSGDMTKVYDELGDLLLQVVFHAQIAKDNGDFDINDVIGAICRKLIRRHPHVFGEEKAGTAEEVLDRWDEIKKEEKEEKSGAEGLKSVPASLPALMRAQKVQEKAAKVGFDWDSIDGALDKVREETAELEEAEKKGENMKEELGDLLFSVVNVARFLGVDAEEALFETTNKFVSRFSEVERMARESERNLSEMTLDEMDVLWEKAKKRKR